MHPINSVILRAKTHVLFNVIHFCHFYIVLIITGRDFSNLFCMLVLLSHTCMKCVIRCVNASSVNKYYFYKSNNNLEDGTM
jgi:hypothetical protein